LKPVVFGKLPIYYEYQQGAVLNERLQNFQPCFRMEPQPNTMLN